MRNFDILKEVIATLFISWINLFIVTIAIIYIPYSFYFAIYWNPTLLKLLAILDFVVVVMFHMIIKIFFVN